jgi:methionine-R-sulfoxide reductase
MDPRQSINQFIHLTEEDLRIIAGQGTETPFSGEYTDEKDEGAFICRRCNAPLYRSADKIESHCGWHSFDDQIPNAVDRHQVPGGHRTEIVCRNCGGHIGRVFHGEGMTQKNTRHCANSIAIRFASIDESLPPVITSQQP